MDLRPAVQVLKSAIFSLEEEIEDYGNAFGGSRTWIDQHPALCVSFDPPACRGKGIYGWRSLKLFDNLVVISEKT
jgi:hypothetical protein